MKYLPPERDVEVSQRNLTYFVVMSRDEPGARWESESQEPLDLLSAYESALAIAKEQVSVWLVAPSGSKFRYWNSKHPDLFNSSVLETAKQL